MTTTVETANAGSKSKTGNASVITKTLTPLQQKFVDDNGLSNDWISIYHIVFEKPFHEKIHEIPVPKKLITDDWEDAHPYEERTLYDYYLLYRAYWLEDNGKLSDDNFGKNDLPKELYINLKKCFLKDSDGQRIQEEFAKILFIRACEFDWHKAMIKAVRVEGIDDMWFIPDGGGTLISAMLRGYESIPVLVDVIEDTEDFEKVLTNHYVKINSTRMRISEWDKHVQAMANEDPTAITLELFNQGEDVTFNPNSTKIFNNIKIPPVKATLDWKVWGPGNVPVELVTGDVYTSDVSAIKGRNVKSVYRLMNEVWPADEYDAKGLQKPVTHNAALFKLLVAGLGALNGHIQLADVQRFLLKLKAGKVKVSNKHINCGVGKTPVELDASTSNKLAQSLNLGGFAPQDVRYAIVFCKLWNAICKNLKQEDLIVQEVYLENLTEFGKIIRYNPTKDYAEARASAAF